MSIICMAIIGIMGGIIGIIFLCIMSIIIFYLIHYLIHYKIYKKADQLKREFNSSEFLFEQIPSEFNISWDDLCKMQELKLCKIMSYSNLRTKYEMVI